MNLDYNSFEGLEIEGRPHVVTVRGKIAARDGKFVGEIRPRKISRARAESFLDFGAAQKRSTFAKSGERRQRVSPGLLV